MVTRRIPALSALRLAAVLLVTAWPVGAAEPPPPLRVLRINPSGVDVRPGEEIVFQFDRPVVPVGRMARDAAEIPIEITPDPGCGWRWLDTSALACRLGDGRALAPATRYRVVVRPGIRTEDGATLARPVVHEFLTLRPRAGHYWFETWTSPALPVVRLTFNQAVDRGSVERHVFYRPAQGDRVAVEAQPRGDRGNSFTLTPVAELPDDMEVALRVEPGVAAAAGPEPGVEERAIVVFRTFPEHRFLGVRCATRGGATLTLAAGERPDPQRGCDPLGGVSLLFSAPVIKEVLRDHLTVAPDLAGGREDYDPWENVGSYSRLSQRPREHVYASRLPEVLKAVTEYRLRAPADGLRDEFGRRLSRDLDFRFYTDHRRPRFHLGHTASVLESGVASHLPVVVTNLEAIQASFVTYGASGLEPRRERRIEVPAARNVAFRFPLEVRDWLPGRSGALAGSLRPVPETDRGPSWFFSQVTPFQVHLKLGHYNSLAWVTDLESGLPVAGAEVTLESRLYRTLASLGEPLARAVTGDDGLALLPGTETIDPERGLTAFWKSRDEPHLFARVRKDGEIALVPAADDFRTQTRGQNSTWLPVDARAEFGHLRAWGFTAQGVYRAGDRVDYKIYVRKEGNRRLEPAPLAGYRLEVIDPMARTVHQREEIELSRFGSFDGSFRVPESGAVGWYRFELEAAFAENLTFYPLEVLISDFTPAPFRVTTDLDRELFEAGDEVRLTSRAALHSGGPYVGAADRVTAVLRPARFAAAAAAAPGFWFEVASGNPETVHQSEAPLDDAGELETVFTLPPSRILHGTLTVESAVRDDRGKRVAARASARYAGRDRYLGLRQQDWVLAAGQPASFEAVVADASGTLVPGVAIRFRVEREKTTAARVKGAGNAYLTRYTRTWEQEATCEAVSAAEPVSCAFTPRHAGPYRLSGTIEDTRGRAVEGSLRRWSIGKGRVLWEEPPGHHLEVVPENDTLRVGDTARYLVKNPFPGTRALVTIERYGIVDSWVETLAESSALIEFPVEPDHLPGFYLSVVVTSPRVAPPPEDDRVDLGKPAFRIGYARTVVKDPYKELVVEVEPGREVYKPRETATVDLTVRGRHQEAPQTEIAVAVLDEAVLDLLAGGAGLYDPYAGLYDLHALDLANYNLLKRLVGWQKFEKKGASPGGGGGPDATLRSLFKFVSYWNPSVTPDAEGRATIEFELPDNLTAWRVLAVAVTPEDRMGLGQASLRVNRPTEIRPALPNQVVEGDRFEARFTVMNRTESPRRLAVGARATGAVTGTPELGESLEAEPYRRYPLALPVAAAGPGEIRLEVTAGDDEDRDGLAASVPVKRRKALETAATWGTTVEDEALESVRFPPGIRTDVGGLTVTAAPTVIGNLEGAFEYMRDYPYVCWEQMLSQAVMAAHFQALSGYLDESLEWPGSEALPQATLDRAGDFQTPGGAMSFWVPRDEYASPYLSAYTALAFGWLAELGYTVPPGVEERLHDYLGRMLRKDVFPDFFSRGMASSVRAVALAALARAGKTTRADLARYRRHAPEMDLFGKAHYLQALERVAGTEEARAELLTAVLSHAVESAGKLVLTETLDDGFVRLLSSDTRTACAVLSALLERGEPALEAAGAARLPFKLVRTVTQTRGNRHHWENTQENLFCTRALLDYSRLYESVAPDFTVRASLDGEGLGRAGFRDLRAAPAAFERSIGASDPGRDARLRLERQGDGRLYYSVRLAWSPLVLDRRRIDAGIEIRREYNVERDGGWVKLEDPARVRRGELVRVDLYVSLPAARNFVVVDDPVPGGLEPVNRQLATASTVDADKARDRFPPDAYYRAYDDWYHFGWTRWSFYHQELRHDAARFYSDHLPAGRYHLSYVAQVVVPGEFTLLPPRVEEMYDPDVFGQGLPGTLAVEGEVE